MAFYQILQQTMAQKCAQDSILGRKTHPFLSQEQVVLTHVSMKLVCGDQAGVTPNMINLSGVLNVYIAQVKKGFVLNHIR